MPATAKKRGPSYSNEEVKSLLGVIRRHLPIGPDEWEGVLVEHLESWPDTVRDVTSIRRKFSQLHNKKIPTGDPRCPPLVKEAKRIVYEIKQQAEAEEFESSDDDGEAGEEDESEEENEAGGGEEEEPVEDEAAEDTSYN